MTNIESSYDVIVVGAGVGGLSAATSLSSNGFKVLVVEKNDQPGGNCTARMMGDYKFDMAIHQLTGVMERGQCGGVLREYGIHEKINFLKVDPFLIVDMPDRSYKVPGTWEGFQSEFLKNFPSEKKGMTRLLDKLKVLKDDAILAQRLMHGKSDVLDDMMDREVTFGKKLTFPFTMLQMLLDMDATGDDFVGRYIKDNKAASIMTASWPYLGLPPSKLSGLMYCLLIAGQAIENTYYPAGSSQVLADLMASSIEEHGGAVLLDTPVKKIIVDDKKIQGVELPDGRRIEATHVVCNAPPVHVYGDLIGSEKLSAGFFEKLQSLKPSLGPFKVYLGLDYDVAQNGLDSHEYLIYDTYDHADTYRRMVNGDPAMLSAYAPTQLDPTLAPKGHSTLILTTMFPWQAKRDWREQKEEIAEEMISNIARRATDVRKHIKQRHILTPEDLGKFSNTTDGAMYGWENNVSQILHRRLPHKSPIKNMYHVGHWSQPGTGATTAIISGWIVGNQLKKKHKPN